jgi:amidohydrolase
MKKENLRKIIELRHELHKYPELSLEEKETKQRLIQFIRDNSSLRIVDRGDWFYVCNKEEDEEGGIAFRADMDALPILEELDLPYASVHAGVSHKCGHDGHMAALCGLALEIDAAEKKEEQRPIYLIFQPAEEIGKGGEKCAMLLKEKGIKEIYAYHNLGGFPEKSLVYRRGLTQPASEGLTIYLEGKPSHASAPENGKNPSLAIAELIKLAAKLEEKLASDSMSLCTIVNVRVGSKDFGVNAGEGEISFTIRAEEEANLHKMEEMLLKKATELAEKGGLKIHHEIQDYFPETKNHDRALDQAIQAAKRLGKECIEMPELWRASEDFGYYTKQCEGAILYIGSGEDHAPLHTPEYNFNDNILETAVDLFLELAMS